MNNNSRLPPPYGGTIPEMIKLYLGDLRPDISTLVKQTGKSPSQVLRDMLRKALRMRIVYSQDGKAVVEYFSSSEEAAARLVELQIDVDIEEFVTGLGWVI